MPLLLLEPLMVFILAIKKLLEECNLHTILDMPGGTFAGAGVKTVVLFFDKTTKTKKVWFYQLNLTRNLGKTNPLNEFDLAEFLLLQKNQETSKNSWSIDVNNIDQKTFDLSVKNPNKTNEIELRAPEEILSEIKKLDSESAKILEKIHQLF